MNFNYDQAVHYLMLFGMLFLAATVLFCLIRAVMGPKLTDRIVAVNMVGVKTMLLIVMVSVYIGETYLVDVAVVYALLSFLAVVVFTKFVLQFKLNKIKNSRKNRRSQQQLNK